MDYVVTKACYINRIIYEKGDHVSFPGAAPADYFQPLAAAAAKVEIKPAEDKAPEYMPEKKKTVNKSGKKK